MIRALARFAGIRPDRIHYGIDLMVDEWGVIRLPAIMLVLVLSALVGCALGFMGVGT